MEKEETVDELPPLPPPEKLSFSYMTLFIAALTVISCMLAVAWHLKRKAADDEFSFDVSQYRVQLRPQTQQYFALKASFPENEPDTRPLQKALFDRAIHNLQLILQVNQESQNASQLYRKSMIGESAYKAIKESERVMEQEMEDVREEADSLRPGWGAMIWQQAHQVLRQSQQMQEAAANAEEEKRLAANRAKREKAKEKAKAKKAAAAPSPEEVAEKARLELEALLAAEDAAKRAAGSGDDGGGGGGSSAKKGGSRRGSTASSGGSKKNR